MSATQLDEVKRSNRENQSCYQSHGRSKCVLTLKDRDRGL